MRTKTPKCGAPLRVFPLVVRMTPMGWIAPSEPTMSCEWQVVVRSRAEADAIFGASDDCDPMSPDRTEIHGLAAGLASALRRARR